MLTPAGWKAATKQPAIIADVWFGFASAATTSGHHQDALRYVRLALENGYFPDSLWADIDLKPLRTDPRLRPEILEAKKRTAAVQ